MTETVRTGLGAAAASILEPRQPAPQQSEPKPTNCCISLQSAAPLSNRENGGNESDISGKDHEPAQEERLVAGGTGGEAERVAAVGVQMGERCFT